MIYPLAGLLAFVLVAGAQDDGKKDSVLLEGNWSMVSGVSNGVDMPEAFAKTGKRTAKDGETTVSFGGMPYFKAKYSVDATKKPKSIDYQMTEGLTKGKKQLGIYEIDGDTVKFCFATPGGERPTDFTAKAGSGRTLSVWKKDKK